MDAATPKPRAAAIPALLAGMQSGLLGVVCMLGWLGVTAEWQQRNFWIPVNLMASAIYGPRAIHSGFAFETISGLAIYVVLYTALGGALAFVARDRLSRGWAFAAAMIVAVGWYYLSFRLLWRSLMPLVALLHVERATVFGHLLYGAVLGAYPARLEETAGLTETPALEPVIESHAGSLQLPLADARGSEPEEPDDPGRDGQRANNAS
jgi:hypothetical protein